MGRADIPGTAVGRFLAGQRAPKVFAIGFNKTGTTSLHRVFEDLGYRSYHGSKWRDTSRTGIYRLYDAFCDGVPDNFRKLDAMFPNAKFILQVRDLDAWLDSRLEHIRRLSPDRNRGADWTATPEAMETWIRRRDSYHTAVLEHFRGRPDELLLINFIRDPDATARIAAFLGRAAEVAKPHANRNPGAGEKLRNSAMIAEVLERLGIPEFEWKNDIRCPSLNPGKGGTPVDTEAV